jgi:hypothetical protein
VAAVGCALLPQRTGETLAGPVPVRIGRIDLARLESARADAPASLPERVETLFDLFWDTGCAGEHLRLAPGDGAGHADVVCTLPGRSRDTLLVVAHLGRVSDTDMIVDDWASAVSLPLLYRSLSYEQRAHTFVFAGVGDPADARGAWEHVERLTQAVGAEIRAIVDLRNLDSGTHVIGALSSDAELRRGFGTVGLALGRSPDSLRLLEPPKRSLPSVARRIPTIAIGDLEYRGEPRSDDAADDARLRDVLRAIAIYLGYADRTLGRRAAGGR